MARLGSLRVGALGGDIADRPSLSFSPSASDDMRARLGMIIRYCGDIDRPFVLGLSIALAILRRRRPMVAALSVSRSYDTF